MPTNQEYDDEQAPPVGVRLKRLRERTGMSLRATARALGLSSRYTTYRAYEENRKRDVLPVPLVRRLLPVFVGRGCPAVKEEELWTLAGVPICYLRQCTQNASPERATCSDPVTEEVSVTFRAQECGSCGDRDVHVCPPLTLQERSFVLRLRTLPPPVRQALHTLAHTMSLPAEPEPFQAVEDEML